MQQYFVAVERNLMMESSALSSAIFLCVAAHYIFNLSYHPKIGEIWLFVQEKIMEIPSKAKIKRPPSTLSHFSGITQVYESLAHQRDEIEQ